MKSKAQEIIEKLDALINFYDPSQARDESGKWSGSGGGSIVDRYQSGTIGKSGSYDWKESADEVVDSVNQSFKGTGIKIKKGSLGDEDQGVLMKIYSGIKKIGEHYAESGDDVMAGLKKALKKSKYKIVVEDEGDTGVYELRPKK